ncbi:BadF/BadG/BcrA/BcrD ATPase family protein [Agromyces sp. H3Y2-19a]|uniref:N-acetylglucosamine kinase n=1 Tax=Agromyces chromiiresistens TaxID=3030835 RepID=UPI0023B9E35A|nr:BadF/BadG/BcrA/BcrD ATPase family protein [Agromyces chromiiresistens]MDF0514495.1 BadF/BadG/BcrA/BcrD ATPase family protein [Agromyces chromiiresistens]
MTGRGGVPLVVAVDGGGSKTDAVSLELDGTLVEHRRGPGSSPHFDGLDASAAVVDELVRAVAGRRPVVHAGLYLSGLDLPIEIERYEAAIGRCDWAAASVTVDNDLYALLRAGTDEPDAVAIVCGTGVNAIGLRADRAEVRFPSLGSLSGDWGGGSGLGEAALWHAARAVDGRGPSTALVGEIERRLGVGSVGELIEGLHFGERDASELISLAPAVFEAARAGDAVAIGLVDRQATELADFARACLTRLELLDREIPVVLGGGIARSRDERLLRGIRSELAAAAPLARLSVVDDAPIVGAALLALEAAGGDGAALVRARATVSAVTAAEPALLDA